MRDLPVFQGRDGDRSLFFFDLGLFLLGPGPFLELLIGDDDAVVLLVRPGVLLLDLLN